MKCLGASSSRMFSENFFIVSKIFNLAVSLCNSEFILSAAAIVKIVEAKIPGTSLTKGKAWWLSKVQDGGHPEQDCTTGTFVEFQSFWDRGRRCCGRYRCIMEEKAGPT